MPLYEPVESLAFGQHWMAERADGYQRTLVSVLSVWQNVVDLATDPKSRKCRLRSATRETDVAPFLPNRIECLAIRQWLADSLGGLFQVNDPTPGSA